MRKINLIVIHCSDSDVESHDDISVIDDWHKRRGFLRKSIPENATNETDKSVGYHRFVTKKGTIQVGREYEEIGAHATGFNSNSIGICFSGKDGIPNELQLAAGRELIINILSLFNLSATDVLPHCQLNKHKSCPRFDIYEKLLKNLYQ